MSEVSRWSKVQFYLEEQYLVEDLIASFSYLCSVTEPTTTKHSRLNVTKSYQRTLADHVSHLALL